MCGICGELAFHGAPAHLESVVAMATAIQHRGPDDGDFHAEGPVAFGHRRLSIIDLSPLGRQPMWSSDGSLCLTFNGEIYNYKEVAAELAAVGHRFRGSSDTEVAINAIRQWGLVEAVRRFIGMFAFAVWDRNAQTVSLVRDRVGIKPLFYWIDDNRLLFGSELRALMAHGAFRKELDPRGLGQFFVTGYTVGEATPLRNVRRVLPGQIVTVGRDGDVRHAQYWSLDDVTRSAEPLRERDVDEAMMALLESAIAYRLVADVPVANFLSGGIDSSLVASVLQKRLGADVLHISVGFREGAFDETPKAAQVARELGLRHRVHVVDPAEAQHALELFPEIFDEPFGDTSGIPTYILSRVAREDVKVALSADGGDEQFCGYESYARYDRAWRRLRPVPAPLRRAAAAIGRALPYRALASAASRQDALRPQTVSRIEKAMRIGGVRTAGDLVRVMFEKAWTWDAVPTIGGHRADGLLDRTVLADPAVAASDEELLGLMMRADYQVFLRDDVLTKVDRASMHVSLEARDPMLDHRIAELAFRLPIEQHYAGGEHKRALKRLLRQWVSESVVTSPKRGFSIPLYAWMRGPWKPTVDRHLSRESIRRVGVLSEREVAAEVRRFYEQPGGSAERLWMLLSFQMWAERWLIR